MGDNSRGVFRLSPILCGHEGHFGVVPQLYERALPQEVNDAFYVFLANKKMGKYVANDEEIVNISISEGIHKELGYKFFLPSRL